MLRGIRTSLFAKLTLIVIGAAFAIILIIGFAIGKFFEEGGRDQWRRYMAGYVRFAAERIFEEPSAVRINAVAEQLSVDIRYQGPGLAYATDAALPQFAELRRSQRRRHLGHAQDVFVARREDNWYVVHNRPPHRILVGARDSFGGVRDDVLLAALGILAALAALLGIVYFLIRKTLAPLPALERNIAAVGRGEWSELETRRRDEIGKLIHGFNRMQRQIRGMLAAKEQLLVDISHEFRSPLARMKVALEFIGDERTRRRLAEDIAELDRLTEQLLESARLASEHGALHKESCEVARLLAQVLAQFDAEARRYLRLADHSGAAVMTVDAARIRIALKNIIDNALKYSELAPHSIVITARTGSGAQTGAEAESACLVITVQDQGPGLAPADLERVFEPFYRADRARTRGAGERGGYGLGMRLCRAIIEAHGGGIAVHSEHGHGVRVTITLPPALRP